MSEAPGKLPSLVPQPDADLEAFRREVATARASLQSTARALDQGQIQEINDRSMITRVVIYVFGISIGAVLFILLIAAYGTGNYDKLADQAADLLKSTVLPILTLVLGYYFGRAGKT